MPERRVNYAASREDSLPLRPALTPEGREQQMISLAMDLVEERLRNGTASSQETTHFLKLGSIREQVALEKERQEIELLKAKKESLASTQRVEELYKDAMNAMKKYSGNGEVTIEYLEGEDDS